MSQPGQLSHGIPTRDPIAELSRRIADLRQDLNQSQAALTQTVQVLTAGLAAANGHLPVVGTGTVTATAIASGSLGSSVVSFGTILPSVPQAVVAYISGFVGSSSATILKATTNWTTTSFTAQLLNTGPATVSFSGLPITYLYFL